MKTALKLVLAATLAIGAQAANADTCIGNCGTLGANGDVTASPFGGTYGYVSTAGGVTGVSPFALSGNRTGSKLTTSAFSANAGSALNFYFNYVTSDGSGFADYGWARLLNASDNSQAAILFTARTRPDGDIIPGFGLPDADATIPVTPIIDGAPTWSPLGSDGNGSACYQGTGQGCGYTGWVLSTFTIATAGNYLLEFGAINWNDDAFQSGLAWDGITVDGNPIDPSEVPVPAALPLMATGLAALGAARRKSKK